SVKSIHASSSSGELQPTQSFKMFRAMAAVSRKCARKSMRHELTLDHIDREPTEARFLVALVHVDARLAHGFDCCVERNEMPAVPLQRQRGGRDSLDRAQGVALDTGHLHQSAHRITGHAKMMLERDFSRIFHLHWRSAHE